MRRSAVLFFPLSVQDISTMRLCNRKFSPGRSRLFFWLHYQEMPGRVKQAPLHPGSRQEMIPATGSTQYQGGSLVHQEEKEKVFSGVFWQAQYASASHRLTLLLICQNLFVQIPVQGESAPLLPYSWFHQAFCTSLQLLLGNRKVSDNRTIHNPRFLQFPNCNVLFPQKG